MSLQTGLGLQRDAETWRLRPTARPRFTGAKL